VHNDLRTIGRHVWWGYATMYYTNITSSNRGEMPARVQRTAIYTQTDGVVEWRSCIEEDDRLNIRVDGTHAGLAFNPQVYRHVAELLAATTPGRPKRKQK